MNKFCKNCGGNLEEDDFFCPFCGVQNDNESSHNNDSFEDEVDNKETKNISSTFKKFDIFSKEKIIEKSIKTQKENFKNMRDDVSYLLPDAAEKLNASLDDCYLTFKTSKKLLIDSGRNKFHHHDKVIILMSILDDKISYVVLARLHQLSNKIKSISLEEVVYSLHFDKISGISYTKAGLDLTMVGGEIITLRATDLFENSITKELNDKFNKYNDNKNNMSNDSNHQPINKADTLMKYKELYDAGLLTREEFDKLKDEVINN